MTTKNAWTPAPELIANCKQAMTDLQAAEARLARLGQAIAERSTPPAANGALSAELLQLEGLALVGAGDPARLASLRAELRGAEKAAQENAHATEALKAAQAAQVGEVERLRAMVHTAARGLLSDLTNHVSRQFMELMPRETIRAAYAVHVLGIAPQMEGASYALQSLLGETMGIFRIPATQPGFPTEAQCLAAGGAHMWLCKQFEDVGLPTTLADHIHR